MGQLLNDRMRQHFNGNEEVRRGAKILFKKNFWAAEIFTNEVYFVRDIFARFTIAQGSEADDEDEPVLLRDIGPMELGQKTAKFRSVEIPLDQLDDQLPPGFSERYLLLETTDGMRQVGPLRPPLH